MQKGEAYSRYSPNVRIGNWFENICLEEDEMKAFLLKRQKTELLIQKTRLLFLNFHKKIELDNTPEYVPFGAVVQLLSCMTLCSDENRPNVKSALSVIINEQVVRKKLLINDICELTVAPSATPCVRNAFKILNADCQEANGEFLRFGENFTIQCVEAEEQPLLLYSMQKSADLTSMFQPSFDTRKRGEVNLPLGLCLKKNVGTGKDIPSVYTKWRCYHANPKKRFETNGLPVPPNCPVVITHAPTNRNLATENFVVQTLFGPEKLVSVQNYDDIFKRQSSKNIWIISNACENNENIGGASEEPTMIKSL